MQTMATLKADCHSLCVWSEFVSCVESHECDHVVRIVVFAAIMSRFLFQPTVAWRVIMCSDCEPDQVLLYCLLGPFRE